MGPDGDLLTKYAHPLVALQQASPQRVLSLEAHDDHVSLGAPEVVLEVMPDASRLGHAARRDDDDAPLLVQSLGLFGAGSVMNLGKIEDPAGLSHQPPGLGVVGLAMRAE